MTKDLQPFNIIKYCHSTDTFLRLFDQYGNQVESQDDNELSLEQCDKDCSNMTYTTSQIADAKPMYCAKVVMTMKHATEL